MVLRDDGYDEEGNGYCRLDDGLSDAQRNTDKDRLAQINGPLDVQMNTEKDRLAQINGLLAQIHVVVTVLKLHKYSQNASDERRSKQKNLQYCQMRIMLSHRLHQYPQEKICTGKFSVGIWVFLHARLSSDIRQPPHDRLPLGVNPQSLKRLIGLSVSSHAILVPMTGCSPAYNMTYRSRDHNVETVNQCIRNVQFIHAMVD